MFLLRNIFLLLLFNIMIVMQSSAQSELSKMTYKITSGEIVKSFNDNFHSYTARAHMQFLIVTLAGVSTIQYNPANVDPNVFAVHFRNLKEPEKIKSSAVLWNNFMWIVSGTKIGKSNISIDPGNFEFRLAFEMPDSMSVDDHGYSVFLNDVEIAK